MLYNAWVVEHYAARSKGDLVSLTSEGWWGRRMQTGRPDVPVRIYAIMIHPKASCWCSDSDFKLFSSKIGVSPSRVVAQERWARARKTEYECRYEDMECAGKYKIEREAQERSRPAKFEFYTKSAGPNTGWEVTWAKAAGNRCQRITGRVGGAYSESPCNAAGRDN